MIKITEYCLSTYTKVCYPDLTYFILIQTDPDPQHWTENELKILFPVHGSCIRYRLIAPGADSWLLLLAHGS